MNLAFNPLDIPNLGKSVATAILETEPTPIQSVSRFTGAGIYAIYYTGDFPAYSAIADANRDGKFELPIYVGKAVPSGGRRGVTLTTNGTPLYSRLVGDHRKSIEAATNLDVADFYVRWLVVESIWIPLGESVLIQHFAPVWNAVIDGFGNHAPGGNRPGLNTKWDTLHPGRDWATRLIPRTDTIASISQEAVEYIRSRSE